MVGFCLYMLIYYICFAWLLFVGCGGLGLDCGWFMPDCVGFVLCVGLYC